MQLALSNWISQGALRLSLSAEEISELQAATIAYLVSDSVDVLAAVCAIAVVRRTTARQEERALQWPASRVA